MLKKQFINLLKTLETSKHYTKYCSQLHQGPLFLWSLNISLRLWSQRDHSRDSQTQNMYHKKWRLFLGLATVVKKLVCCSRNAKFMKCSSHLCVRVYKINWISMFRIHSATQSDCWFNKLWWLVVIHLRSSNNYSTPSFKGINSTIYR